MPIKLIILLLFLAVSSFVYNMENTRLDEQGVLHETAFLPLGYLFLGLALVVGVVKFVQTMRRRK
ncbi:MAG: DUF3955 domain-containing protein [Neisseriaceae bacterium]|nr:DUF3955 domain-containing protein [Neisseriaceae bacterium]MBP6861746.1 DUF3955 domain-containing protein [Neisseriaceae bacterium]